MHVLAGSPDPRERPTSITQGRTRSEEGSLPSPPLGGNHKAVRGSVQRGVGPSPLATRRRLGRPGDGPSRIRDHEKRREQRVEKKRKQTRRANAVGKERGRKEVDRPSQSTSVSGIRGPEAARRGLRRLAALAAWGAGAGGGRAGALTVFLLRAGRLKPLPRQRAHSQVRGQSQLE